MNRMLSNNVTVSQFSTKNIHSHQYQVSSPKLMLQDNHTVNVCTMGMIEDCILYPSDKLRLGVETEGDLLLLRATHVGMIMLYPSLMCGRRYGEHIILNTPHQPTIDQSQWEVVGAIKGLERSLEQACLGTINWKITLHGIEGVLSREWKRYVESQSLPPEYLAELANEIAVIEGASIQAGWSNEALEQAIVPTPGHIVFSLLKKETSSGFVSSWAVSSRRDLRRKRRRRRTLISQQSLYPVPQCRGVFTKNVATVEKLDTSFSGQLLAGK